MGRFGRFLGPRGPKWSVHFLDLTQKERRAGRAGCTQAACLPIVDVPVHTVMGMPMTEGMGMPVAFIMGTKNHIWVASWACLWVTSWACLRLTSWAQQIPNKFETDLDDDNSQ